MTTSGTWVVRVREHATHRFPQLANPYRLGQHFHRIEQRSGWKLNISVGYHDHLHSGKLSPDYSEHFQSRILRHIEIHDYDVNRRPAQHLQPRSSVDRD
jgi:hypothetical protein